MNWLAHIFLSELNIDFQMGNYLADPLKGKVWKEASTNLKNGIKTHFIIDSFTDTHLLVKESKIQLREKGLLKSIVIDITYDYFLTKNWDLFCNIPMKTFTLDFYNNANNKIPSLPENVKPYINRIIHYDILNKYHSLDDLKKAFERFDKRLSNRLIKRDTVSSYINNVCRKIDVLENNFLIYFPELCQEVKKNTNKKKLSHFKI